MTPDIKPLIAGNWKMNGTAADLPELSLIAQGVDDRGDIHDSLICVPATLVERASRLTGTGGLMIGGQDCHGAEKGAHTGDVSAAMLVDAGADAVIVGHSERRTDHGEMDTDVLAKTMAAHDAGLMAIVCVGETLQEREAGAAMDVVSAQLEGSLPSESTAINTVVAYEPVWAIGTGLTPSLQDIEAMHGHIRQALAERFGAQGRAMRILYGGSMKPSNAGEIIAISNVDGGLIGGASLKSADFLAICAAVTG